MTIKELAAMANVSISTVSKIMNGKDNSISSKTREKVLSLAKEHKYSPYASVLSHTSANTMTFGVIFDRIESIKAELMGIIETAETNGYQTVIATSDSSEELELEQIEAMIRKNVTGILWRRVNNSPAATEEILKASGIPYLIFGSQQEDSLNIDFADIAFRAVNALVKRGHKRIAYLEKDTLLSFIDHKGYVKCLVDNHISPDDDLFFTEDSKRMDDLLEKIANHKISAVFVTHYETALKLLTRIHLMYLNIPNDISISTLRDDSILISEAPEVSSIVVPHRRYGKYLAEYLLALINKTEIPVFEDEYSLDYLGTIGEPYRKNAVNFLCIGGIHFDKYYWFDTLPTSGMVSEARTISHSPGGKGLNQAVCTSKLGNNVSIIGCVGNDTVAESISTALAQFKINVKGLCSKQYAESGTALIFVQNDGNSIITNISGANADFTEEDIYENEELFSNSQYCLISTEIPVSVFAAACYMAKKHGLIVMVKPATTGLERFTDSVYSKIDFIFPNQMEASVLCPEYDSIEKQAGFFISKGVKNVIITMGKSGCYVRTSHSEGYYPALECHSIDNTGASDIFISTFASYFANGYTLDQSIKIANIAASLSTTQNGVITAMPTKETLDVYMKSFDSE